MSKIVIRQGGIEDVDSILKLLNKELPQYWNDNPKDFWVWTNKNLSHKESIITLAEYKNKIIGYYCIIPKLLKINNGCDLIQSGMGIHAVVDSDYRKNVSIMEITNLAYKIAKEHGIKMIYGFPNNNYYLIQEKLEKWDKVEIFNSIEIKMLEKFKTVYELTEVKNKFNMEVIIDDLLSISKDSSYYYDRYINHPRSLYKSFFVTKNNKKVGLLVTKIFESSKGHIIDFIINKKLNYEDVIKLSNNYFLDNGIDLLSVWPTSNKFKKAISNIYSKLSDGFNTNFYVKFLDKDFKTKYKNDITNIDNWNLPMGVSDAF